MKSKLNSIYLSDAVKSKLERISLVPLTTIVAPAGYGKTTAVRQFCEKLPAHDLVLKQSVFSANVTEFWRGFSEMMRPAAPELFDALIKMDGPPADGATRGEFLNLMSGGICALFSNLLFY